LKPTQNKENPFHISVNDNVRLERMETQINLCIKNMFKAIDSKFPAIIPEYVYSLQACKM